MKLVSAKIIFPIGLILFYSVLVFAQDTITMEDGTQMRGFIIAWSAGKTMLYFKPLDAGKEPQWISISDIQKIEFSPVVIDKDKAPEEKKGKQLWQLFPEITYVNNVRL